MARYEITRACGHTERIQICGPVRDRDSKADWEASRDCYECYQRKLQEQRAQASGAAATQAQVEGLPTLSGSEKQIAWAESIRAEHLPGLRKLREMLANPIKPLDARAQQVQALGFAAIDAAINRTSAHEWIEHRHDGPIYSTDWLREQPGIKEICNAAKA